MAKQKATITLDREKADEAQALVGADSLSSVIDTALSRLIRTERLRRDIAAYLERPPTADELIVAELSAVGDLADETDWAALYSDT